MYSRTRQSGIAFLLGALVATTVSLLAFPHTTHAILYSPGETLDPACAPTDLNCGVTPGIGSGTTGQIPYYAADGVTLSATSTITILSSGRVGIGTTTPGSLFSLGSTNGINFSTATSTFSATGGINLAGGCFAVNGTCVGSGGGGSGTVGSGTTGQIPYYAANGTTLTATSTITVLSSGRVGIGTTTPQEKLSLRGGSFFQAGGDTTASSTPTIVGGVKDATNLDGAHSVFVSGRYAYVVNGGDNSLRIIDVSNPASPTIVGGVQDNTNLFLAVSVFVSGRYAYVANRGGDSLRIIDVSNPAAPRIVGGVTDNINLDGAWNVFVSGRYAYVANFDGDSFSIVDVSNPASPTIVGGIQSSLLDAATSVFVSGRYAYVTTENDNSLRIIDISNPASPTIVGGVKDDVNLGVAQSVFVSGRYAYVANAFDDSLRIIDVSNPASPVIVGGIQDSSLLDGANSVSVSGRYAYVVNGGDDSLRIIDVSNPASPKIVGGVKDATNLNGAYSVYVSGRYAYVASEIDDSLRIIDISGIEVQSALVHSLEAGSFQTRGNAIVNDSLYVGSGLSVGGDTFVGGSFSVVGNATTTTLTDALFSVNPNGTVGIGTSTPSVIAGLTIASTTGSQLSLSAGAGVAQWAFRNAGGTLYLATSTVAGTATTTIPALTFQSATGNLGIGTTTPYSRLTVWGSNTGSTSPFQVANSASTTVFAVYNNGNATYSGSIFQSSDKRLKDDIESLDASSTLSAILALDPVSYTRIDQPESGTQLGFIAQAVQKVFPELVSTNSSTKLTPNGTLTLNYVGLIAPLVKAVQALAEDVRGFAESITTNVLTAVTGHFNTMCLKKTSGESEVCITGDELEEMLEEADEHPARPPEEPKPNDEDPPPPDTNDPNDIATSTPPVGDDEGPNNEEPPPPDVNDPDDIATSSPPIAEEDPPPQPDPVDTPPADTVPPEPPQEEPTETEPEQNQEPEESSPEQTPPSDASGDSDDPEPL